MFTFPWVLREILNSLKLMVNTQKFCLFVNLCFATWPHYEAQPLLPPSS